MWNTRALGGAFIQIPSQCAAKKAQSYYSKDALTSRRMKLKGGSDSLLKFPGNEKGNCLILHSFSHHWMKGLRCGSCSNHLKKSCASGLVQKLNCQALPQNDFITLWFIFYLEFILNYSMYFISLVCTQWVSDILHGPL